MNTNLGFVTWIKLWKEVLDRILQTADQRSNQAIIPKSSLSKIPSQWIKTVTLETIILKRRVKCTVGKAWKSQEEGLDPILNTLVREGALAGLKAPEVDPGHHHVEVDRHEEAEAVEVVGCPHLAKVMLNSRKSMWMVSPAALNKKILRRFLRSVVPSEVWWWKETTLSLTSKAMLTPSRLSRDLTRRISSVSHSLSSNLVST